MIKHEDVFASKEKELKEMAEAFAVGMGWDGVDSHRRSCSTSVTGFRDALSEDEYYISGMCQLCQDEIFGGGE